MFLDTVTLTLNAINKTLTRVDTGGGKGVFRNVAEGLTLTVTQSVTKARRSISGVRIDHEKIGTDLLLAGVSRPFSASVRLVMDYPNQGYTIADKEDHLEALAIWLSVQGNRDKLINGES